MLRAADLADLGTWLQLHDLDASSHQLIAAARLLAGPTGLHAEVDLAPYLAPIFCSDAAQQQHFHKVYTDWLRQRGVNIRRTEDDDPPQWPDPPARKPPLFAGLRGLVFLLLLLVLAAAAQALLRECTLQVVVLGDGKPLPGARVQSQAAQADLRTDAQGSARLAYRLWQLSLDLRATHADFTQAGSEISDEARVSFGSDDEVTLQLRKPPEPVQPSTDFGRRVALLPPPPASAAQALPQSRTVIDLAALLLPGALVLLSAGWWLLVALRRRGFLERLPADGEQVERQMQGSGMRPLQSLNEDLRHLGRELRRRRTVPSRALDVGATVAATLRRGGRVSLVFGTRVEPEYLVLVDRASAADQQVRLAHEVVRTLHAQNLWVERYEFDADPRRALHAPLEGRAQHAGPQSLGQLRGRHQEARLVIISDGRGLVDRYTGRVSGWVADLLAWQQPVLVTPQPRRLWGVREWLLQQAGLALLPLDREGLQILAHLYQQDKPAPAMADAARDRPRPAYQRDMDLLLDRHAPPPEFVPPLLEALARDLAPDGMAWLAGCAVYPELHWGITLAVGDSLVGRAPGHVIADRRRYTQCLAQVVRLPWLRWGFMPDWLREALLAQMPAPTEAVVRQALTAFIARLDQTPAVAAAATGEGLKVALPPPSGWWGTWSTASRGLRAWLAREPLPEAAEDKVFLRFMSGKPHRLAVDAGERLQRLLYRNGAALAGPRAWPLLLGLLVAGGVAWTWPPLYTEQAPADGPLEAARPVALALIGDGRMVAVADSTGRVYLHRDESRVFNSWRPDASMVPNLESVGDLPSGLPGAVRYLAFVDFAIVTSDGTAARRLLINDFSPRGARSQAAIEPAYMLSDVGSVSRLTAAAPAGADNAALCATPQADDTVRAYTRRLVAQSFFSGKQVPLLCAQWNSNSLLAVLAQDGGYVAMPVDVLAQREHQPVATLPAGSPATGLAASTDGRTAAVARADGSVWLLRPGQREFRPMGALEASGPLAMSGDGLTLAVADRQRRVEVWRLAPPSRTAGAAGAAASAAPSAASAASAPPKAIELAQAAVEVMYCAARGDEAAARRVLGALLAQRTVSSATLGVWPAERDARPDTLVQGYEIRHSAATRSAADALARQLSTQGLGRFGLRTVNTPAPNYIAVFTCVPPMAADAPSAQDIQRAQVKLKAYFGLPVLADGRLGPMTVDWLRRFQKAVGLPVTGQLDDATRNELDKVETKAGPPQQKPASNAAPPRENVSNNPAEQARPPDTAGAASGAGALQNNTGSAPSGPGAASVPLGTSALPAAAPPPPPPVSEKVSFAADAFFDFDKAAIKPEGQAKLADLVDKPKGVNLEVVIAVGHTDNQEGRGSAALQQKLSVARAEAVKKFLTSKGIENNRVYTEGKGAMQPVADNKTAEGRAKNRRTEIQVVGVRARK